MGIVKTKGIIIAESNMGDFDKMLTMLTPGLGKISCAAKGARRQNSALLAGTQFLCFGEYILYKSNENYSYAQQNKALQSLYDGISDTYSGNSSGSCDCDMYGNNCSTKYTASVTIFDKKFSYSSLTSLVS